jgi:hypothetical protein
LVFCLPLDECQAPVQIRELGSQRYVFRSESTDFRFGRGGYSSNFLNLVRDDGINRSTQRFQQSVARPVESASESGRSGARGKQVSSLPS